VEKEVISGLFFGGGPQLHI